MKTLCKSLGFYDKTNKDLFVKIIGGAMSVGGFLA